VAANVTGMDTNNRHDNGDYESYDDDDNSSRSGETLSADIYPFFFFLSRPFFSHDICPLLYDMKHDCMNVRIMSGCGFL